MQLNPSNTDIDRMFREMAKADGYDARKLVHTDRLLRTDSQPCETPDDTTSDPAPVAGEHVFGAAVVCVCIALGFIVAVLAWVFS